MEKLESRKSGSVFLLRFEQRSITQINIFSFALHLFIILLSAGVVTHYIAACSWKAKISRYQMEDGQRAGELKNAADVSSCISSVQPRTQFLDLCKRLRRICQGFGRICKSCVQTNQNQRQSVNVLMQPALYFHICLVTWNVLSSWGQRTFFFYQVRTQFTLCNERPQLTPSRQLLKPEQLSFIIEN